jgi:hypothetical protein
MARGSIVKRPSGNYAIVYYVDGKQQAPDGRVRHAFEPIVIAATLALIPVLVIESDVRSEGWQTFANVANWVIWGVFLAELGFILIVAEEGCRASCALARRRDRRPNRSRVREFPLHAATAATGTPAPRTAPRRNRHSLGPARAFGRQGNRPASRCAAHRPRPRGQRGSAVARQRGPVPLGRGRDLVGGRDRNNRRLRRRVPDLGQRPDRRDGRDDRRNRLRLGAHRRGRLLLRPAGQGDEELLDTLRRSRPTVRGENTVRRKAVMAGLKGNEAPPILPRGDPRPE